MINYSCSSCGPIGAVIYLKIKISACHALIRYIFSEKLIICSYLIKLGNRLHLEQMISFLTYL